MIGHFNHRALLQSLSHTFPLMDAKLKALRVVDLRQILATANVSVPAKATKNDIIAKIQASKNALDAYAQLYPPDDLLAPPEEYPIFTAYFHSLNSALE